MWNALLARVLAAVRTSNPDRLVLVGPASMNDPGALAELVLPQDRRLIAAIHYYAPFEFTHQGAPWVPGAGEWLGTRWGSVEDRAAITHDLSRAVDWARDRAVPLLIGEFGTYERADLDSRRRWTSFVRTEAERLGVSWCYWDFGTDFGAFDLERDAWLGPLSDALVPR
jgi:endoglucanase